MPTDTAERQPVLVCTGGALEGARHPVGEAGLVLGRGDSCDVVLDDPGVSREHARVFVHNEAVWVQDAGSRNGCFVNGRRLVRHKQLSPGDELRLGDHSFTLELVEPFPGHDSVSTFGAPSPAPVALPPPSPAPPDRGARGPLIVAVVVLLVLAGAGLIAWVVATS